MSDEIKSGKQVIDEFFSELPIMDGVDKEIAEAIIELQKENKITNTNLSNELLRIRETRLKNEN